MHIVAGRENGNNRMKLTFVSNYFNHHQRYLCEAFAAATDVEFTFLQIEDMDPERVRMGWAIDIRSYPFVRMWNADKEYSRQLAMESDAVIFGGVDDESYILPRIEAGKFTLRYQERIYKEGQWKFITPRGLKKKYHDHIRFRKSPVYLLCAGAFVASDFALIHAYPGKKLVWGYFPEVIDYTEEELHEMRADNTELQLLWSGRMLDWKHPDHALAVAARLKNAGIAFHLTFVGGGEMEEKLRDTVAKEGLNNEVTFAGFLRPEEVREQMRRADIYLFTSDQREGWGASVNEAMNSGCCVVAYGEAGAVPFLIRHGRDGMVYEFSRKGCEEYVSCVEQLARNGREEIRKLGTQAYRTITECWRPEYAASRLLEWLRCALRGDVQMQMFGKTGDVTEPMQEAVVIHNGSKYCRRQM